MDLNFALLLLALMVVAFLYSSVGHGGASGYLAVMALLGFTPAVMKSSALIMNLAVSLIAFIGFYRAGFFRWSLFWPLAAGSVPLAYVGGTMSLPDALYKKILAICLLISIVRMLYKFGDRRGEQNPSLAVTLFSGAGIGLISGLIGIGGGILLSPLILLMRWATLKETAAISALFIFVNSLAGLLGLQQQGGIQITPELQFGVLASIAGGLIGSYLGSKKFNVPTLRYLLATGLIIAAFKLLLS